MPEVKRAWDMLPKAKRKTCLAGIITFFKEKRDENIGLIVAEEILDFFLQNQGKEIYNKGVFDVKNLLQKRFDDLAVDMDLLIK